MTRSRSLLAMLAATAALSACSWMPDMGAASTTASQKDNNLYGEERTAEWQQAPAPTPALTATAAAPAPVMAPATDPVVTPMPEPAPEPMKSAEPMVDQKTMK